MNKIGKRKLIVIILAFYIIGIPIGFGTGVML